MLVPDWLVGTADQVQAAVAVTAREWARAFFLSDSLPAPAFTDPAELPLLVFSSSDYQPAAPAVRLFAMVDFQIRADDVLGPGPQPDFLSAFETHTGQSAWGSFDNLMSERWPSSFETVRRRLTQVRPHLGTLAATTVVDVGQSRHPALQVLERSVDQTLANWDAPPGSPLPERVAAALARMQAASAQDVADRVESSIVAAASTIRRVRHRDWFTADRVREYVSALDSDEYEALTGCTANAIASEVYTIDRAMP